MWGCVGDFFYCRIFSHSTVFVTSFGIYIITCPPQDKNLGGEGASTTYKQLPQSPFPGSVTFQTKRFCIAFYDFYPPSEKVFYFSQASIRGNAYFIWQS